MGSMACCLDEAAQDGHTAEVSTNQERGSGRPRHFTALLPTVALGVVAVAAASHFWGFRGSLGVSLFCASLLAGTWCLVAFPRHKAFALTMAMFLSTAFLTGVLLIPADWPTARDKVSQPATATPMAPVHTAGATMVMPGRDLQGVDLSGMNLEGADLRGANLTGANLTGTHLDMSCLRGTVLTGAKTSGASFAGADLSGATADFAISAETVSAAICASKSNSR